MIRKLLSALWAALNFFEWCFLALCFISLLCITEWRETWDYIKAIPFEGF